MKKNATKLLSALLTLALLLTLLPVSAAAARDTIDNVVIEVARPVVGEPLTNCVPSADYCEPITGFSWTAITTRGQAELGSGAGHTVDAKTRYLLTLTLTPMEGLYTFSESAEVKSSNGSVTVGSQTTGRIVCTVLLTPMTRETEVEISVPQPAAGATPGAPTAAGGHTVSDPTWYENTTTSFDSAIRLAADGVFNSSRNYWMEATVTAGTNSLFGGSTAVTVNGKPTTILFRDLEANTITFRYYVGSEELLTVAGNIYVANGSGGYWHLTPGGSKTNDAGTYTAAYENGILTLTNTGDSTIGGACQVPNQSWYAGIYADGDLTVHFDGDFHFDLSGTPETASFVYGIYAVGDLILVKQSDGDCTVSFSPAEGVLATHGSSGIYCEIGSLTVEKKGNGDFTLNANAVGVRPVDGAVEANFTNNGIYAAVSITIGDNCTVNATAADVELSSWGTTTSRGIYAGRDLTIGENAVVTATGGNINPSQSTTNLNRGNYQHCCGVYILTGDITVTGGTLIATGGNVDHGTITGAGNMGLGQECYGIYCNDSITLNDGTITARAGYSRANAFIEESSFSRGIRCSNLTVSSGTLTAAANDAWLESTGLRVQNKLSQTGGTITGTGGVAVCLQGAGDGSRGIYVVDTLTATGGALTATGGTMGIQQASVGLQASKIELSGTAQVTGLGGLATTDPIETPVTVKSIFASYPGDSIGVWTFDDLTVDGNAVLTATGGTVRGNDSSAAKAMSIGLNIITADNCTISGSGKIVATGGETHYGGKGNNYYDSSHGIYGEILSLTIDGTTVIATGGSVSTKTVSGNGVKKGGVSYGLYLPGSSLTLEEGAELTATGGDNPTYSDNSTQTSQVNNSYGAYVGGDITVTDSVLTATGGLSIRTVGLYNGGTVTLNGLNSRLTATADEYYEDAPGAGSEQYCYGAMNGDGYNPGGAYMVNGGILLLQGQELAMSYQTNSTLTAATIWCSYNWDGSNPARSTGSAALSSFYSRKYVKADSSSVNVTINGWTYGNAPNTPSYTVYEGDPEILWTDTTHAGASYSSSDAPTEAGSYTVTITYPGGQTGSADFTVAPRAISDCSVSLNEDYFTYDGYAKTMGVTVKYGDKELVEGTDYEVSGNTKTNAGQYDITVTGQGNFTGTKKTPGFYIMRKVPKAEDFVIPEIEEYAYTGEPVTLELPTLKEPMTGVGEIKLGYYQYSGVELISATPIDAGSYEVKFQVLAGDNFLEDGYTNGIDYGTLTIQKGVNPMTLLRDSIAIPRGGSIDIGKFVTNAVDSDDRLVFEIVDENDCATASSLNGSTLTAGNVTGEFQVRITADGSLNYDEGTVSLTVTVSDTVAPIISGTAAVTGTSAVTRVQVENYFYESTAYLLVAQYSGGQMKAVQTVSVTADGTFAPVNPFAHAEGCTYKAFLLDADTYAPLCAAADLS